MVRRDRRVLDLDSLPLNYDCVGSTCPSSGTWTRQPSGYRRYEETIVIGRGDTEWTAAAGALMEWEIKTRSGFQVAPASKATEGQSYCLTASIGLFDVREPIRVVTVVAEPDRRGFAYGTLEGHPVSGEEAFIVHRNEDNVLLTVRSLTRPSSGAWRIAFPALLVAQRFYRGRYRKALARRSG
jgi:uncharacterized protein (UPF0548 family)